MAFSAYVGVIRRWWLTFLVAVIVGAVCGWLAAGTITPRYLAEVRVLVGPVNAEIDTLRASSALTRTYADLATSDGVLEDGLFRAGISQPPSYLDRAVRTTPGGESRTIVIQVELPSADEAARAANGIAEALTALTSDGAEGAEGALRIVNRAEPTAASSASNTGLIVLLATVGALIGAVLIVAAIEFVDGTVRDADQLRRVVGGAVLGVVAGEEGPGLMPARRQRVDIEPAYRVLFSDIVARASAQVRSIMVLSATMVPQPVAHQAAIGLARAASGVGTSVVVLEAEAGEWIMDGPIGSPPHSTRPDTTARDAVAEARSDREVTRHRDDAVRIRTAALAERDLLIVDAGSSWDSFTGSIWAGEVDAVVVVVPFGKVHSDRLGQLIERLQAAGAEVVWVVGMTRGSTAAGSGRADADPAASPDIPHGDEAMDPPEAGVALGPPDSPPPRHTRSRAGPERVLEPGAE